MAERVWTDEQRAAIDTRDRTLLVSAAAGSGKTATLTERIIRSLTDETSPVDISELLVVTFTKAAASELRAKIAKALEDAVAKYPNNEKLARQLYLLPSAKIRTIDSFCNEILRENADLAGVKQGFRIADAAEMAILSKSILEGLIDAVYNGLEPDIASPEDFDALSDTLTSSKRTEELSEVLYTVWAKCQSCELGVNTLRALVDRYNVECGEEESVEETYHGRYLINATHRMLTHYREAFTKLLAIFSTDLLGIKYLDVCSSDIASLDAALACSTYETMRDVISHFFFGRCPSVKAVNRTEDMEIYRSLRDSLKDDIKKFSKFYGYESHHWYTLFATLRKLMGVLYRFEVRFDEIFTEEKMRRSALDYADIERLTYNLLIKDGERTDIAHSLMQRFRAVYIDEYQDVNSLQNRIFEAISRADNRFMVGDIKQSIYGFRSARPEIFASMKVAYPKLSDSDGPAASIFMSKNFRCDKGVVDFVNSIFDRAFSLVGDLIGYEQGDRLEYAKVHEGGDPPYTSPTIHIIDKDSPISEPRAVARKIEDLLKNGSLDDGSAVRPSDIAIILRYAKGKYNIYAEALAELGIPSEVSAAKDFFLCAEVLLVLCLLNAIDNPRRDIYLAGLMCSPLFDFNADDLYRIRKEGHGDSLYESLCSYTAEHTDYKKGIDFLRELSHYRAISEGVGVDTLIYRLYYETGLMAIASANGGRENLTLLYEYARGFEGGSFKGLYSFIAFINNLIDKRTSFDENRGGDGSDAVRIVTCHESKGLEYPIVFLCETGTHFSDKDSRTALAFDEDFGISVRPRTPSGLAVVDSPIQDIINYYVKNKNFDEELRVLYVALTRARERLFITGTPSKTDRDEYDGDIRASREYLSAYGLRSLRSMLDVILVCAENSMPCGIVELLGTSPIETIEAKGDTPALPDASVGESDDVKELTKVLTERFNYEYPHAAMTRLPEKMSVSAVSPTVLDGTDGAISLFDADISEPMRILPKFAGGTSSEESAKRGIATHYFMQFCDLELLERDGAERELERLVREGFISSADAERVRLSEIKRFASSQLFRDMRGATRVWRELRFNTEIPACILTSDEALRAEYGETSVLVQGVIDCIVEYPDGTLGLFDYKTDRLSAEERASRELAEQRMREKHSQQLHYYALAIERIFGRRPSRIEVYSLAFGDCLDVSMPEDRD